MAYEIQDGLVYSVDDSGGECCIGNAEQYSTTQTDTQIIYQWQTFDLTTGVYDNDTTNTTPINGVTPTNGQVIIPLPPVAPVLDIQTQLNNLNKVVGLISDNVTSLTEAVMTAIPTLGE
jgi:hypothetical protein